MWTVPLGGRQGPPSVSSGCHCTARTRRSRCLAHPHGHQLLRGMGSGSRRGGRLVQWAENLVTSVKPTRASSPPHPRKLCRVLTPTAGPPSPLAADWGVTGKPLLRLSQLAFSERGLEEWGAPVNTLQSQIKGLELIPEQKRGICWAWGCLSPASTSHDLSGRLLSAAERGHGPQGMDMECQLSRCLGQRPSSDRECG